MPSSLPHEDKTKPWVFESLDKAELILAGAEGANAEDSSAIWDVRGWRSVGWAGGDTHDLSWRDSRVSLEDVFSCVLTHRADERRVPYRPSKGKPLNPPRSPFVGLSSKGNQVMNDGDARNMFSQERRDDGTRGTDVVVDVTPFSQFMRYSEVPGDAWRTNNRGHQKPPFSWQRIIGKQSKVDIPLQ